MLEGKEKGIDQLWCSSCTPLKYTSRTEFLASGLPLRQNSQHIGGVGGHFDRSSSAGGPSQFLRLGSECVWPQLVINVDLNEVT